MIHHTTWICNTDQLTSRSTVPKQIINWHRAGVSDHDLLFSEKGAEPTNSKLGSGAQFPELPPPGQRSAGTPSATRRKPPAKATSKTGADLSNRFLMLDLRCTAAPFL